MKAILTKRTLASLFALCTLLAASMPASARQTINPIELISSGGFTLNQGVSVTTKLFVDVGDRNNPSKFWVRVENDPGTFRDGISMVPIAIGQDPQDVTILPKEQPVAVSIKYFPMYRYLAIMRAFRDVGTYGVVNPYVDGAIICDGPNTTIRLWYREIFMAYNCGAPQEPDADAATFLTEELISALREETVADPDMEGDIPQ